MIFCPLPGTPLVTQGFVQNAPFYAKYGMSGHNGVDFDVDEGTPVYAPHDGTVTVKDSGDKDYGLHVVITDGRRHSVLAHLSATHLQTGQTISQGDEAGKAGSTGDTTGAHLHWTFKLLKNGIAEFKDNGYQGAVDPSELTRLWLDQNLLRDATYTDDAKETLTLALEPTQRLRRA